MFEQKQGGDEKYSAAIPHIWSAEVRRAGSITAEQTDPVISCISLHNVNTLPG